MKKVIYIYSDPTYDEYGFPDYGTGSKILTSEQLFGHQPMTENGDPIEENWAEITPEYWINNEGEVYSFKSNKTLSVSKNGKKGYPSLRLSFGDKDNTKLLNIHRLLADNFIPNPNNDPYVRHLNDDPDYYSLENLEWGTAKDNWHDAIKNGNAHILSEENSKKGSDSRKKSIKVTDLRTGDQRIFPSLHEAEKQLGYTAAYICKCLKGNWENSSWKFEYV